MLRIRPYKPCDAMYIVKWVKSEYSMRQWSAYQFENYPLTVSMFHTLYDTYESNTRVWQMTAVDEQDTPVGHFMMRYPNEDFDEVRLGFIIIDDCLRGKGYGKEMIRLGIAYAFSLLQAERVSLAVFENNPAARYCYESLGFKASCLQDCMIQNENWPSWMMLLDKEDFDFN